MATKLDEIGIKALRKGESEISIEIGERGEVLGFSYDVDAYIDSTTSYLRKIVDPNILFTQGSDGKIHQKDMASIIQNLQNSVHMCLMSSRLNENFVPHGSITINKSHIEILILLQDASLLELFGEGHRQKHNNIGIQNLYNAHKDQEIVGYIMHIGNESDLFTHIINTGISTFEIDAVSNIREIIGSSEETIEKIIFPHIKKAA